MTEGAPAGARLKLGILLWSQGADWPQVVDAALRIEAAGYDNLWTWDHLLAIVGDPRQPIFEGWTALAALAALTRRVRLGLLVGANTFRNPGIVAKMAATIDHISSGRSILGLGGAWFGPEHTAHGIEFGSGFGERLDWLDEATAAIRRLLDGETVTTTEGRYRFLDLRQHPRPLQARLPIMIGGGGERKTLRIVARYADAWNVFGTPDELRHKDVVLRRHCAEVGRDPGEIERTVTLRVIVRDTAAAARAVAEEQARHNRSQPGQGTIPIGGPPGEIARHLAAYVAAGFTTIITEMATPYDAETIERFAGEVGPLLAGQIG